MFSGNFHNIRCVEKENIVTNEIMLTPIPHGDSWLAAVPGGAGGEAGLQPPVQVAVVEAGARGHQARAVEDSAVPGAGRGYH